MVPGRCWRLRKRARKVGCRTRGHGRDRRADESIVAALGAALRGTVLTCSHLQDGAERILLGELQA